MSKEEILHDKLKEQYKDSGNLDARIALHQRFSTNKQGWYHWLFEHYQALFGTECRVLELGGGSGAFWKANLAKVPATWQLSLSDFSLGMLKVAQHNSVGLDMDFVQVDAQAIPFPDGYFDVVIANHMLYHVPDRPRAFAEIRRVLKDSGILFAATNGPRHLKGLPDLTAEALPEYAERVRLFWQRTSDEAFRLDNGMAQLQPWFQVTLLDDYQDALHVTETEPLVAYITSVFDAPLSPDELGQLRGLIDTKLARDGAIDIAKDTGAFLCRKIS